MTNDGGCIVFVFFEEVRGTRESDLVDVAVNLFCRHTNTLVADGERSCLFVDAHRHFHVCGVAFEFTFARKGAELLGSIHCVSYDFAEKNFVVAIQELLDNGEYVFGRDADMSFLCGHVVSVLMMS